jgi:Zn-dependent protease with chaperone function
MTFALRGLTLALAWFLVVNITVSALVAHAAKRSRPTHSAAYWFRLRILPGLAAMLFVAAVFAPSYWRFEPRDTMEGFDVTVVVSAALAGGLLAAAAVRGLLAWCRAAASARALIRVARPLPMAGAVVRAYEVDAEPPLMALAGVLRPRLLVTRGLMNALSGEELSACIAHELAHARAWDNLKRLAMRVSPDALSGTGLARAIERRWASASEHAADAAAGRRGITTRWALASALVKIARLIPESVAMTDPVSPLVGGGEVASRVRRLLDDRALAPAPGRYGARFASVGAIVALATIYGPLLQAVHHATELLVHSLP